MRAQQHGVRDITSMSYSIIIMLEFTKQYYAYVRIYQIVLCLEQVRYKSVSPSTFLRNMLLVKEREKRSAFNSAIAGEVGRPL